MQLYIPRLGDTIQLTAPWQFNLFNEDRNSSLMEFTGDTREILGSWARAGYGSIPCTIPEGEKLKIDRIYIRKGLPEFDSVTFLWVGKRIPGYTETRVLDMYDRYGKVIDQKTVVNKFPARAVRFWAKLDDVNTIQFVPVK